MIRNRIRLAASAIALGAALIATPAAAQEVCDVAAAPSGTASGTPSLACGAGATASGNFSTAIGENSVASGQYSTAIGNFAQATGFDATAVGVNSLATDFGTAYGFSSRSTAPATTAIGNNANATADGATALGWYATATGINSTAVGRYSQAIADGAVALGRIAVADGVDGVAIGRYADNAGFANSVALGANSTNTAANQVHVGGRIVSGVANGAINATSTDAINGSQINTIVTAQDARDDAQDVIIAALATDDDLYVQINSIGAPASATGTDAIAIGGDSVASAANSIAVGEGATATHTNSVALGTGTVTTAANQVNVGGRTIGGVANGVLANDAVNVGQLNAAVAGINSDITTLFDQNDQQDRKIGKANEGVAMALAMESPNVPAGSSFALSGGVGGFQGKHALATAISAAVGSTAVVSGGVGVSLNTGEIGYRAGFQVAF